MTKYEKYKRMKPHLGLLYDYIRIYVFLLQYKIYFFPQAIKLLIRVKSRFPSAGSQVVKQKNGWLLKGEWWWCQAESLTEAKDSYSIPACLRGNQQVASSFKWYCLINTHYNSNHSHLERRRKSGAVLAELSKECIRSRSHLRHLVFNAEKAWMVKLTLTLQNILSSFLLHIDTRKA